MRTTGMEYGWNIGDNWEYFQETFRACSDIQIKSLSNKFNTGYTEVNSFNDETTSEIDQFEDYYDELFGRNKSNDIIVNNIDTDDEYEEAVTIQSVQTKKLQLLKKKLAELCQAQVQMKFAMLEATLFSTITFRLK